MNKYLSNHPVVAISLNVVAIVVAVQVVIATTPGLV
jgi:hypothetical protein